MEEIKELKELKGLHYIKTIKKTFNINFSLIYQEKYKVMGYTAEYTKYLTETFNYKIIYKNIHIIDEDEFFNNDYMEYYDNDYNDYVKTIIKNIRMKINDLKEQNEIEKNRLKSRRMKNITFQLMFNAFSDDN